MVLALVVPAWVPSVRAAGWEGIPAEQMALAHAGVDADAAAEMLLSRITITDDVEGSRFVSVREHFCRIKVFTAAGAQDLSLFDIDYVNREGTTQITDVDAHTVHADGTVLPFDRKSLTHETLVKVRDRSVHRTSFAFPSVEPGSIVECRWVETLHSDYLIGDALDFQWKYPLEKMLVRIKPFHQDGLHVNQLTFHSATRPNEVPSDDGYFETVAVNQRALAEERDMPPERQVIGFMLYFYTYVRVATPERFWRDVGRRRADQFDVESRPDESMRTAVRSLVADAATDSEKVKRIAGWVRTQFRLSRSDSDDSLKALGLRRVNDAHGAWKQKGGGYKDALVAFAALARAAGLEVRWVLVPRRTEIFFDRNMLHESFLDSYQVAVRLRGVWRTFDPVARYLPWDMQGWGEEGNTGLLCDHDETAFIETSYSQPSQSMRVRRAELELSPDGTLEGSLRVTYSGHLNARERRRYADVLPAAVDSLAGLSQFPERARGRVTGVRILNADDEYAPLALEAHIVLPQSAVVTGRRLLLSPSVFYVNQPPRYTSSTRRYPVYYEYPWAEVDTVLIHVPAGWKAESIDAPNPLDSPGVASYALKASVSDEGRLVTLLRRFEMGIDGTIFFPVDSYAGVQRLWAEVQQRDGTTIVLTREDPAR